MRTTLALIATSLFIGIVTMTARADTAPPSAGEADVLSPLTPERAVEIALARNPELRQARERLEEIRAQEIQARALMLPQVTAEGSARRDRDPGLLNSPNFEQLSSNPGFDSSFLLPIPVTSYDYSLTVEQPIYQFGKLRAGIAALRLLERSVDTDVMGRALDVARDTAIACFDVALADARLDVLQAERRSRERQVEQAADFLDIGAGTRLQLLQAQAALAGVRPRLLSTHGEQQEARARLNRLLGRDPLAEVDVAPELLSPAELVDIPHEAELAERVKNRPELVALRLEQDALRMQQRVVRADRLPSLRFTGSYGIRTIAAENLFDSDFASWSAGVVLEVPVYDGSDRRGQLDEVASRIRQKGLETEARRAELLERLVRSATEYRSAREASEAAAVAEERAIEAHRVAQEEYRFGAATVLDTLETERTLTEARLQRLSTVRDALVALTRVTTLAGRWPGAVLSGGGGP
ncbi:MAG: TolC family protein [Acidobacteriota bacterium]|nr:TolC family protein [Acidobacteriota bacterium]